MTGLQFTTGLAELDNLIGGVKPSDNLVWAVDSGAPTQFFVSSYLRAATQGKSRATFVSFNASPQALLDQLKGSVALNKLILVDCFTSGKGGNNRVFSRFYKSAYPKQLAQVIHLKDPANPYKVRDALDAITGKDNPPGRYLFDSLTGMAELWNDESSVLKFFAYSCPCLYDLKAVAYWFLEKKAHSEKFLANIKHITQVVIEVDMELGRNMLAILKSHDRVSPGIGLPRYFSVDKGQFRLESKAEKTPKYPGGEKLLKHLSSMIKIERNRLNLSQGELAKRVDLTTSAISQIESGSCAPSLGVFLRIMNVLGMRVDSLMEPGNILAD